MDKSLLHEKSSKPGVAVVIIVSRVGSGAIAVVHFGLVVVVVHIIKSCSVRLLDI